MPRIKQPCCYTECEEAWTTLRCARCRRVRYCCADHQKKHWKAHKEECEEVGGQGEWVAEGVRKEAPEVGRKPFIWELRPIPHFSPQYDPDTPEKIGYDWRGEEKNREEDARAKVDTKEFRYLSTTKGVDEKHNELRQNCAWLHRRLKQVRSLMEQLEQERHDVGDARADLVVVTSEHVTSLQADEKQHMQQLGLGGAWGQAGPNQMLFLSGSVEMDLSDLEGLNHSQLRVRLGELTRMHAQAIKAEKAMSEDIKDRKLFDVIETGHETRDMLENGIRRAHMEARLGRIATRDDIVASMKIPFHLRPRIMGYDPNAKDKAIEGAPEGQQVIEAAKAIPFNLPFKEAPKDQQP